MDFLILIGSLGFFIYGMKVMSDGIQKAAGSRLQQILSSMTRNRFLGVFTGFLITCLVQSSSATTVMVVSFANAGLINLVESIAVIMGANIGTTITAWLVTIFGFKVDITAFTLPIIAVGFPLMFSSKDNLKAIAEILIGFALLFLGLDALKNSVPDLAGNPEVLHFLSEYSEYGILSTLIFVLVGTVITLVVQSSSAAMALTLTLLYSNIITFEMAAAMVLGENIGTTITANMAAIVANVHAKRAARAHFVFNIIGVVWMIIAFPFFLDVIKSLWDPFQRLIPGLTGSEEEIELSIFHSLFNIINTSILVWFIPQISRLVVKMVPSKTDDDEEYSLEYIGSGMMLTTEASLLEVRKELVEFSKRVKKMSGFIPKLLVETDKKKFKKLMKKVKKYEEITDRIELDIANYLAKVSEGSMNQKTSIDVRSMLSIASDLEIIGDINYQMSKTIQRKSDGKIWFTPEQRKNLLEMFDLLEEAMVIMMKNQKGKFTHGMLEEAYIAEKNLNNKRNELRKVHLKSIENKDYQFQNGIIYKDLFSSVEKVGDHVINVSEALAGKV